MKKFAFAVAATLAFGAAQAATNPPAAPAANNLPNPTAVLKTTESAVKSVNAASSAAVPATPAAVPATPAAVPTTPAVVPATTAPAAH